MIATHSTKALDSRMKQKAIRAAIIGNTQGLFSSQLLPLLYFAAPSNAADIRLDRMETELANTEQKPLEELGLILPEIQDGRLKQVLIPFKGDYLAITPVPNLSVVSALNKNHLHAYHKQVIQPVPAAFSNHGDPIATYNGCVKLIENCPCGAIYPVELEVPVMLITAYCQDMNVSSCYVSTGLPALTSIGGIVHVLERDTGLSLPFSFGIKNINGIQSTKRGTNYYRSSTNQQKENATLITNEITANADIAFILKIDNEEQAIKVLESCKKLNRFSGGILFNVKAAFTNKLPEYYWYQKVGAINPNFDEFIESQKYGVKLIQSGFALLEEPVERDKARVRLHAWAEPVFSLINMGQAPCDFFSLHDRNKVFVWE